MNNADGSKHEGTENSREATRTNQAEARESFHGCRFKFEGHSMVGVGCFPNKSTQTPGISAGEQKPSPLCLFPHSHLLLEGRPVSGGKRIAPSATLTVRSTWRALSAFARSTASSSNRFAARSARPTCSPASANTPTAISAGGAPLAAAPSRPFSDARLGTPFVGIARRSVDRTGRRQSNAAESPSVAAGN